jgi:MFS transporter, DHA2 family, methylenomycin A resistance protein
MLKNVLVSLNIVAAFKQLGSTREKKTVLKCLAYNQLLVQLSTIPIALAIPSVAKYFQTSILMASWTVLIRLLILGSMVYFCAKLGEKFGYAKIFILGALLITVSSLFASISPNIWVLILTNGFIGLGAAMITANANPILTLTFDATERGKAFSIPIIAARCGTLLGMALFGVFLQYFNWRLVFLTSFPIGVFCLWNIRGLIKFEYLKADKLKNHVIDYVSASLFMATIIAFTLSLNSTALFQNSTSGISSIFIEDLKSINFQIPIIISCAGLAICFIIYQSKSAYPFFRFNYFKEKPGFSMAVYSDHVFHLSMFAIVVLVPILVQEGLGYGPLIASWVLLPGQSLGIFLPILSGYIFDKNDPPWLRPGCLMLIAIGIGSLAAFSNYVPLWGIGGLLMVAFAGTHLFNAPSNANIMNNLPEDQAFASGLMETTRQMGHLEGGLVSATVLALVIPVSIIGFTQDQAQEVYRNGFATAAFIVIFTMLSGAVVAGIQSGLFKPIMNIRLRKPAKSN